MGKIGGLIKAPKLKDSTTTLQKSSGPSAPPLWVGIVVQMAQDKRHDMGPGILSYWKVKLQKYGDIEITQALLGSGWEFFPSVDNVISAINANRAVAAGERADLEWQQWRRTQKAAEANGLLATDEQYDELRKTFKKAASGEFGTVNSKPDVKRERRRISDCVAEVPSPAD
jgi:hypothetical protein